MNEYCYVMKGEGRWAGVRRGRCRDVLKYVDRCTGVKKGVGQCKDAGKDVGKCFDVKESLGTS